MRKRGFVGSQKNIDSGLREEEIFQKCVQHFKKLPCIKSSDKEDRFKHIDFHIGNGWSVDVKQHKRIHASDKEVSNTHTWIELKNINGNLGWIDGYATHIAYSFTTHYKLFNRAQLRDYIFSKVDIHDYKVKTMEHPTPYQVYNRSRFQDRVVLVPIQDLIDNVHFVTLDRDESLL